MGNSIQPAPCGHQVSPSDVNSMVNTCLDKKSLEFSCPICGEVWEWKQVQELMQLSPEQKALQQNSVDEIVEGHPDMYKKCPSCCCVLKRPLDSTDQPCQFVQCSQCVPPQHFCWSCLAPWLFSHEASAGHCSNKSCGVVAMLLNCDMVLDSSSEVFGCPLFRACPKCHSLIMHTAGCQYVKCSQCKHRFCFICLERKKTCMLNGGTYLSLICAKKRAGRQRFVT
ncbi:probable E3 ubiquitin-protein ligase RNF144A isoform X1 [Anguilla anguilla]|uniref:probable E3 ubiquitin-protein ligase RNF144A isoform X1 n=1 Tax=Anguilla anguilla TaxID=7936 RepID=UPI0015AD07D9|nr:probable E3 ubiquitin-protein ligase RNF144A isoform X1 [Anguilla anguilla]